MSEQSGKDFTTGVPRAVVVVVVVVVVVIFFPKRNIKGESHVSRIQTVM